ncbi:MAG TPA: putative lipid II flippase FtsW [Candidatus Dormibacteraeota bacterium]|nr:putative lipid II flippase FtsW [Candidatus Dormibacteraeota bacterium]
MVRSLAAGIRSGLPGREEGDRWLLLLTLLLVGAGLAMVLSASTALAYAQYHFALYYFLRQLAFAGMGTVALLVLRRVDYHRYAPWAPALAALAAVAMLATLVPGIGLRINGASRWLNLGPLGQFQPSEAGKLAFTLFLASWVDRRRDRLQSLGDGFLPFLVLLAGALGLLMLERDLGSALVMGAIFVSVYFTGGGRKRHLALALLALLVVFLLLVLLEGYRVQRINVFLHPFKDPLGTGFQSSQALIGLGSGGLTGVGLGQSVEKYFWLPEADTDFIFAIIGEETGLVGTTLVLLAFVILAVRGYRIALRAPDRFGVMVAAAITTWVSFQAMLNMGTVTDTLPITGVPLPFISYGGTALAITMAAMGILLNVAAQGERQSRAHRRTDAAVDLGRRDWRAPLASARRRPGVPR